MCQNDIYLWCQTVMYDSVSCIVIHRAENFFKEESRAVVFGVVTRK